MNGRWKGDFAKGLGIEGELLSIVDFGLRDGSHVRWFLLELVEREMVLVDWGMLFNLIISKLISLARSCVSASVY